MRADTITPSPELLWMPPARSRTVRRMHVDAQLGPVRRLAVLRALSLGDMVCATPALRGLRQRFPTAHITLVGQAWARGWAERIDMIDDFVVLPPHPLTGEEGDEASWSSFVAHMRSRELDLAVQLHGSGCLSNGVVAAWGARHMLAFHDATQQTVLPASVLGLPWPERGSEVSRLVELVRTLGWPTEGPADLSLSHPVTDRDRATAMDLLWTNGLAPGQGKGWICVHPGSKWASRRWPTERFTAVARELAHRGHVIVLTGAPAERELLDAIGAEVPHAINLCGQTDLWTLGAVIEGARLLLSNDTGVSHIAAALRVPSVIVSCGSDVARWSPTDPVLHRVLWSAPACRPCLSAQCTQTDHVCAKDLSVAQVMDAVTAVLG